MIFEPVVFLIPGFGTFWFHKREDDSNAYFSVRLKGVYILWLKVVHGDGGVSDRDHFLSVEEYSSCLRL